MFESTASFLSRESGSVISNAHAVKFVGKCLSYRDTLASTAALRSSILEEETDWAKIVKCANCNGVTSAFWLGLNRKGLVACLPAYVRDYLALIYDLNQKRNQTIRTQAIEAAAALNRCGIRPIFMKGCLTLLEGLPDSGSSMMADIDILVKEDEILKAFGALRSLGYDTLGRTVAHSHAWTFHRSMSLVTIDLHRHVGPQRDILPANVAAQGAIAIAGDEVAANGLNVTHRVCLLLMSFSIFERDYCARQIPLRNFEHLAFLCHRYADEIDWQMIAKTVAAHRLSAEAAAWGFLAVYFLNAPVPTYLYRRPGTRTHFISTLLQLSFPLFDLVARRYAAVAWPLNRFRMDYLHGCGTDGFSLLAARIGYAVGILARRSSALIQHYFVLPGKARPIRGRQ